ncbi:hypothetical protein CEXT_54201, partial [Caerostris extrusa]
MSRSHLFRATDINSKALTPLQL